ncbi:hypothetical protein TSUD_81390 [Trifolium subterraneum]|uniref:Tic22-like family protein n=1 Tax=Trifolium subterraneum TaxID=3900 RepID=A0A2Z6PMT6_TRISU|nr:hypothetical protein TSUD_81390 [Trifolium subterraneum]
MNFDNFHKALSEFQTHCSNIVQNLTTNLNRFPNPPPWARITQNATPIRRMSTETIEQRLEGVPVYALSNSSDEFLLVSGASTGKHLGLFCFKKEDAEALLHQVTAIDPLMPNGSKVVPVALNKVFQLKVNGVAFRLIPEFSQVKNALHEMEKSGVPSDGFFGVPIFQVLVSTMTTLPVLWGQGMQSYAAGYLFLEDLHSELGLQSPFPGRGYVGKFQHMAHKVASTKELGVSTPSLESKVSRSLILKSQNKRYRPLFFRKEDLENSLEKASGQLNRIKSSTGQGDIEVAALEDVINEMKENSTSKWDDVVFIPPGFDVSTDPNRQ